MSSKENIRMTEQRRVILEEIKKSHRHLTASEVYDLVRGSLPNISLGTVYRNLETLSDLGLIRRLDLGDTKRRYDFTTEKHYHIRCVKCGKVEDIAIESLDSICPRNDGDCGWRILDHNLEVTGICPICNQPIEQNKETKEEETHV